MSIGRRRALRGLFQARASKRALAGARRTSYRPQEPRAARVEYQLALRKVVDAMRREAAEALAPELPLFSAPSESTRSDADPLQRALDRVRRAGFGAFRPAAARVHGARVAGWAGRETARALGLPLEVLAGEGLASGLVEVWVTENVGLIRGMVGDVVEAIGRVVRAAAIEGLRVEELAAKVEERFEVGDSRAALIARDQVLKLNADVTQARQTAAGVQRYEWSTSRDERVRGNPDGRYPNDTPSHWDLDGQTFRWDDPPASGPDGERAHPGQAIQCRCIARPVLDDLLPPA